MSKRQAAFDDLVEALRLEIFGLVASFEIVGEFMMPLMRQPRLVDHYPSLLRLLPHAASTGLILSLCRLFERSAHPRRATLGNLLRRVRAGEGAAKASNDSDSIAGREAFMQAVPDRLARIIEIEARLEVQRNAVLAHHDLTRSEGAVSTVKWDEVREFIALARAIVGEYQSAFCGIQEAFDLPELAHESAQFRIWARLDDYERHCAEEHP